MACAAVRTNAPNDGRGYSPSSLPRTGSRGGVAGTRRSRRIPKGGHSSLPASGGGRLTRFLPPQNWAPRALAQQTSPLRLERLLSLPPVSSPPLLSLLHLRQLLGQVLHPLPGRGQFPPPPSPPPPRRLARIQPVSRATCWLILYSSSSKGFWWAHPWFEECALFAAPL